MYIYKKLNTEKRDRNKAKSITLLWDVSLSMKHRDTEKEFQFLETYIKHLGDVKINLIKFSNTVISEEKYTIKSGICNELMLDLANSIYDGGTSYDSLFNNVNADEILLFSDGMKNLSDFSIAQNKPVFVVNSIIKANHSELKNNAEASNGKYINLKKSSVIDAFNEISKQSLLFLGVQTERSSAEIYPNKPQLVSNDFSLTGKGLFKNDKITLNFGYGDEITQTETITINSEITNELVKRIWAQQKLSINPTVINQY